jgi:hypothetical protein
VFRKPAEEAKPDAIAEYRARQDAERAKMDELRKLRADGGSKGSRREAGARLEDEAVSVA